MAAKWVPLVGKAEIDGDKITYIAAQFVDGPNAGQYGVALIKSNIEFESGEISFKAVLGDPKNSCQVVLNHGLQPEVFVGLQQGGTPYGIALFRNGKWEFAAGVGAGELPVDKPIAVRVRVLGSKIDLFIDDVKVCSAIQETKRGQLALFFAGPAACTVLDFAALTKAPKAFVVMQFSEQFDALYGDVIKPTCEKFGFDVIRADDIYRTGSIIEDIVKSIEEASVVIADITPDNPNVFYEVGYAHAIKKPTILLSDRRRDKLPFDVSGFRTLFYDNTIGGKGAVEENLTKHLENITV